MKDLRAAKSRYIDSYSRTSDSEIQL